MNEQAKNVFHSHSEQVSPQHAEALQQAADELGKFAVNELANEGETYRSYRAHSVGAPTPKETIDRGERTVSADHVAVAIHSRGDTGPLYARADALMAQEQLEQPPVEDQ